MLSFKKKLYFMSDILEPLEYLSLVDIVRIELLRRLEEKKEITNVENKQTTVASMKRSKKCCI